MSALAAAPFGCSGDSPEERVGTVKEALTTTVFSETFSSTTGGFSYADDKFRATTQPSYASGVRVTTGGNPTGALKVSLGGVNNTLIAGMSGGWSRAFTLGELSRITVTFQYNLTQTADYESSDLSEILLSIDGVLRGFVLNDHVAQLVGDGNGGTPITTGWQTFHITLPPLAAGSHTVTVGAFNNQKNASNESTTLLFDNISVQATTSNGTEPEPGSCDGVECCPPAMTPVFLTSGDDNHSNSSANRCIVALSGRDTIASSMQNSGAILAGPDDDTVMGGAAPEVIRGGDGRDTLYAYDGANLVSGNFGDDVIFAGNGSNFVVPGPGIDTVSCGTASDSVAIYDLCEISAPGEQLDGSGGYNTLYTPVPLAQLQLLGVNVANFQKIVVAPHSCLSDCVEKPDCHGKGKCIEGTNPGDVTCECEPPFLPPDCSSCPTVDDGNPCTFDHCDPATGVTVHDPVSAGTPCSPGGAACTGTSSCDAVGQCVPTPPPPIDDQNVCTTDACTPGVGVTHLPVPSGTSCADGEVCNGNEVCNATGVCVPGTPPLPPNSECTTENACPEDGDTICDGTTQTCTCVTVDPDDGNDCTLDQTKPDGTAIHTPHPKGTACGPGRMCNGTKGCDGKGHCVCTDDDPDDDNDCTADQTNPGGGTDHIPRPDGTPCPLPFFCSTGGQCNAEAQCLCVDGDPDDGNSCTQDTCTPAGVCTHTTFPPGTKCMGEDLCNGTCDEALNCVCDSDPIPEGSPLRIGTVNIQFLTNIIGITGNGYGECDTDFWGDKDFECLAEHLAPKILASDYDVLLLNEAFSGREELLSHLKAGVAESPKAFPYVIEAMDSDDGHFYNGNSGLMVLSRWPFDTASPTDSACFELDVSTPGPHLEVTGPVFGDDLDDKAVGVWIYTAGMGADALAKKGVGFARVVSPQGLKYNLLFSHMQSAVSENYEEWVREVDIRSTQVSNIVSLAECVDHTDVAATIVAGDLNINGDLSNPYFSPELDAGLLQGDGDGRDRRLNNRFEWDKHFGRLSATPEFPNSRGLGYDTWAYPMTNECTPVESGGNPPPGPDCRVQLETKIDGTKGMATFDRGLTVADQNVEDRLDYLLLHPEGEALCAQHVTVAWNLLTGRAEEGGITPTVPTELLGGSESMSDHYGLNAEINLGADQCNPASAMHVPNLDSVVHPVTGDRLAPTGDHFAELPYQGAVHWYRIDQAGTWTFNVASTNFKPPGSFPDNGLDLRVYRNTDFSHPLVPMKGEVWDVPPVVTCDGYNPDTERVEGCHEVPGFVAGKFHVPEPPLYVKVYHPELEYPPSYHGEYRFLFRRAQCTSQDEACFVAPFEGTLWRLIPGGSPPFLDTSSAPIRRFPEDAPGPLWYTFYVEAPDGNVPQTMSITLSEEFAPASRIDKIEIVRASDLSVVSEFPPPSLDGDWIWRWSTNQGHAGLLDLQNNPTGADQKYYLRVHRPLGAEYEEVTFQLFWETNLTWFFGPALGGEAALVHCEETTDTWFGGNEDEIYMQVVADGARYPEFASDQNAEGAAEVNTSFSDDHTLELTERILPQLGTNQHGRLLRTQGGIKFVNELAFQLIDEDGAFNGEDDWSNVTFSAMHPGPGKERATGAWTFGEANPDPDDGDPYYSLSGGNFAHDSPARRCFADADCDLHLRCVASNCR